MNIVRRLLQRGQTERRLMLAVSAISAPGALGAVISLLSTPLLIAWFPPAEFGEVANALATASILAGFASLRLEVILYKVPPEERPLLAAHATLITMLIAAAMLVVVLPIVWSVKPAGQSALSVLAIAAILVTSCISNIGVNFLIGERRYLKSGLPKLASPLVLLAVAAALRFVPGIDGSLVVANVLALGAAAALYLSTFASGFRQATLRGALGLAARHRRYILFAVPQNSIALAGFLNAGMLLISYLYGKESAGQVFMAYRLMGFPGTLLGIAFSNFITAEFRDREAGRLRRYALVMTAIALALYLPLLLAILAVPDAWVPPDWREAMAALPPITLLCLTQSIIGSFGPLLLVHDRAGQMLGWEVVRLIVPSLVIVAAWHAGAGDIAALWLFVLAQLPLYVLLALMVRHTEKGFAARPPQEPLPG